MVISNGACQEDGQVRELDETAAAVQRLSPAVDELVGELAAPVQLEQCRKAGGRLATALTQLLHTARYMCSVHSLVLARSVDFSFSNEYHSAPPTSVWLLGTTGAVPERGVPTPSLLSVETLPPSQNLNCHSQQALYNVLSCAELRPHPLSMG